MTEHILRSASPFVDTDVAPAARETSTPWLARSESPFLQEYALDGGDGETSEDAHGALGQLFAELYDDEFEEAVEDVADELVERHALLGHGELDDPHDAARAEDTWRRALDPVAQAAETYLSEAEARFGSLDARNVSDARVFELLGELEPRLEGEGPAFEQLLGGLVSKFKKVAAGAVNLAKKGVALAASPLLGPLFAKLKGLVRPLLERVLKFALNKVPVAYRPLAQGLLGKLQSRVSAVVGKAAQSDSARPAAPASVEPTNASGAVPAATDGASEPSAGDTAAPPAAADAGDLQQAVDQELLELLVSPRDEFLGEAPEARSPVYVAHDSAELAHARSRFVRELSRGLERGEAPGPAVENFLPAVMVAVRAGVKLAGRTRVVSFLGDAIARLIAPLIGKQSAPVLGKMLADVGLRTFFQAELADDDLRSEVAEAVASTVEETARSLAMLPEHVLDTPELLELSAYEAFEAAAAANFPPALIKPALREWEGPGAWLALPVRGPKQFKKFSHVFDVTLPVQTARALSTFGGGSLASYLRDCLRLTPDTGVNARVHLYELMPGARPGHIARFERERGLFPREGRARALLHPLHAAAAQSLLGAPRLGRELDEREDAPRPRLGQRLYYLEVPEASARALARPSHLHARVDFARQEIRACLYLSEALAQRAASLLRTGKGAPAVVRELRAALEADVSSLGTRRAGARLRFVGAAPKGGRGLLGSVQRAAFGPIRKATAQAVAGWLWQAVVRELDAQRDAFLRATEGPEDGVRLCVRFADVPGLPALRTALVRGAATASLPFPPRNAPHTTLTIHAGPKHG